MDKQRIDFNLPDDDLEFLNSLDLKWEAIEESGQRAVIIYDFPFPSVFQPEKNDFKVKIPADYTSGAALDMFFTSKTASRKDGKQIQALTESTVFCQKPWWQWSRHYPAGTPWRPGINTLTTHINYMKYILEQEAKGLR